MLYQADTQNQGCLESLDSLLYYPAWITDGGQGTLSNNILGSAAGHPFYKQVTSNMTAWSWNYLVPYITVHYGSGQWFLGAMWDQYHETISKESSSPLQGQRDGPSTEPLTRLQMDMRPGSAKWVYFNVGRGGTWDAWDHQYFEWFGNEFIPLVSRHLGLAIPGAIIFFAFIIWFCVLCRRRRKSKGYSAVKAEEIEFGERVQEDR